MHVTGREIICMSQGGRSYACHMHILYCLICVLHRHYTMQCNIIIIILLLLIILCIPILVYRPDNSGRQYVSYEVIGQNMVSVPTHFFKVIACQDVNSPQLSVEVGQSHTYWDTTHSPTYLHGVVVQKWLLHYRQTFIGEPFIHITDTVHS